MVTRRSLHFRAFRKPSLAAYILPIEAPLTTGFVA